MNTADFDSTLGQFDLLAEDISACLADLLGILSKKKVPPRIDVNNLAQ